HSSTQGPESPAAPQVAAVRAQDLPETDPPPPPHEQPAHVSSLSPADAGNGPILDPAETTEPPAVTQRTAQGAAQANAAAEGRRPADAAESSRDTSPELAPESARAAVAIAEAAAISGTAVATESAPPRSFTPVPE